MSSLCSHGDILLMGLKELFDSGELTDVVLLSMDTKLSCHMTILAACSPYFRAMFRMEMKENNERTIELHDVDPETLSCIIEYIYTGKVYINNSNVQSILITANMLQIDALTRLCVEHATRELDRENCVDVFQMADFTNLMELKASAKTFIFNNFQEVAETDVLCFCSLEFISEILSSDDLITEKEEAVFMVLAKWTEYNTQERLEHFPNLFQFIRIPLLDKSFIISDLISNDLILSNPVCLDSLASATACVHRDGMPRSLSTPTAKMSAETSFNNTPRKGMFNRELLIFSGGSTSEDTRSFTCFDPETFRSYVGVEQHPTFDAQFKIQHFKLIVANDNTILFLGGVPKHSQHFDGREAIPDVYRYVQRDRAWIACSPMSVGRCSFAVCNYQDRVYVFGGAGYFPNGSAIDHVEFYNTDLDVWQQVQPMPVGISHQAVAIWKSSIFLLGGIDDDNAYLNTVLLYSVTRDSWCLVPTELTRPRADGSAFIFQDRIYLLGGADKYENKATMEVYDPDKNQWTDGWDFPEERKFLSVAMFKNCLYVCGGFKNLSTRSGYHRRTRIVETKDLYKYDFENDKWSCEAKIIPILCNTCCAVAMVNVNFLTECTSVNKE